MVLPPVEIKIKRKRSDEPVDFLHVQEPLGKKQRCATEYVFYRKSCDDSSSTAVSVTSQSARITPLQTSRSPSPVTGLNGELKKATSSKKNIEPRCFHICRSITPTETTDQLSSVSRKRKAETIFIERRPIEELRDRLNSNTISSIRSTTSISQIHPTQARKAPGLATRKPTLPVKAQSPAPLRNVFLPCGTLIPWDVTSQELVTQMQAYTLAEIKKNLCESKTEHSFNQGPAQVSVTLPLTNENHSSRFKPKVPALRYKDRFPEKLDIDKDSSTQTSLGKPIEDDINNNEWVMETYLRIPISVLEEKNAKKFSTYGFLVLDSQAEIDEFYQDDLDFEEEDEGNDEEDENAENHHSADYPDEEVASDDEFDRGAYRYTNDINEFESDTLTDDEEQQRMRYPWMKTLWSERREESDIDQYSNEEDYVS